nr:hypothetical protein [Enterococcus sp. DIV0212c]
KLCISKSLDYEADSIVSSIGKVSSENFDSDTNELTFNLDELPIDNKNEISINFKGNKATESATITGNVVYTDKNFDDIKTYNTDISESNIEITPKPTAPLIVQFVDETGESLHSNITFVRAIGTTINMTEEEEVQQALQAILAENYQLVQKPENETQVPVLSEESTVQYKFRGTIYFKSVPENLSFGSISLIDSHVSVNQPKYKEPLVVKDTRKEKTPWKLSVTVKQPLTSVQDSKQILYRAIRYKKNDATMVNLSQDEEQLVDQGAISANGEYNVSEKWEKNKSGLVLNVFKNEVSLKGAYQAKLLWKIAETP